MARKSVNTIKISGKEVVAEGAGGFTTTLDMLKQSVLNESLAGMQETALPPGVKWQVKRGDVTVYILQLDPCLRNLRVAEHGYGKEANYKNMTLAMPYVILKVRFNGAMLDSQCCELFYSNDPLENLDQQLYMSNLLNVSPFANDCHAWICTQYLSSVIKGREVMSHTEWLHELVKHLWDSGFNRSSEAHEGESGYSISKKMGVDKRVTDFEQWQKHSIADPSFVMGVKWFDMRRKTPEEPETNYYWLTVRGLIEKWVPEDNLTNSDRLVSAMQKQKGAVA